MRPFLSLVVVAVFFISPLISTVSADFWAGPLSIQNGQLYFSRGTLLGKVTTCNSNRYEPIGYTLTVENTSIDQTYSRKLLAPENACSTVDLTFTRDFYTASRMGDTIRMSLKLSGDAAQYNGLYTGVYYSSVVQEHLTAYSQSKTAVRQPESSRPASINPPASVQPVPVIPPTKKKLPGIPPKQSVRPQVQAILATAANSFYTIRGKVSFDGISPAANTPVSIVDGSGQTVTQTYTDRDGRYTFTDVTLSYRGTYRVTTEVVNYSQVSKSIDMRLNPQTVNFNLQFTQRVDFSYRYLPEGDRFFDNLSYMSEGSASLYVGADTTSTGFDFESRSVTDRARAVFYFFIGSGGNDLSIYTTRQDSGAIDLGEAPITAVRYAPYGGYLQAPTRDHPQTITEGDNYAIYDKINDTYAVIHINQITAAKNVVLPSFPTNPYYNNSAHYSPNRDYTIHGRVVDEDGRGVSDIRVRVATSDLSQVAGITTTNAYGDYDFSRLSLYSDFSYLVQVNDGNVNHGAQSFSDSQAVLKEVANQVFTFTLRAPRQIDFLFKYNLSGTRTFDSNDYYSTGSASVTTYNPYAVTSGFNFITNTAMGVAGGAFYAFMDSNTGKLKLYANNVGQGGVIDLGIGSIDYVRSVPGGIYDRFGVEVQEGHNYAIYDQANGEYAVIHIDRITLQR
ncbi:carboxypeptidase regulatory-like domain-containing protein [Candidatus Peregrinibacteria bacterium]|nr:carboxypeptidase regulatory-like domain-containing protein [Candidatus Peregrinibacteria bacterium]